MRWFMGKMPMRGVFRKHSEDGSGEAFPAVVQILRARSMGGFWMNAYLPVAHAADVHVHKIGLRVIADPAAMKRKGRIAEI